MTYYDVYVGLNDDTFKWEGGNWSGNFPRNGSPKLPAKAPFMELMFRIADGTYEGKQLDWGAYGAKVTKGQIFDFIQEFYDDQWLRSWYRTQQDIEELNQVYDYVLELDNAGIYVLVALET